MSDLEKVSTSQLKTDYHILGEGKEHFEFLKEWTALAIRYAGADSASLSMLTGYGERIEKLEQAQLVLLEEIQGRGEWCE